MKYFYREFYWTASLKKNLHLKHTDFLLIQIVACSVEYNMSSCYKNVGFDEEHSGAPTKFEDKKWER